jgi:hypothetical protein
MRSKTRVVLGLLMVAALLAGSLQGADSTAGLTQGTADLKSAGALAFGPNGILFVGDPRGAAIFAIDTDDRPSSPANGELKVNGIDEKVAGLLGTTAKEILINALAVNPLSGDAYLSVSRGKGPDAAPAIVRVNRSGKVSEVSLKGVKFAKASLPNATSNEKQRALAITGLAYVKGTVYVAGLSNEDWASNLRAIPFPFKDADRGTGIEIWHGAHGKFETKSPIRTFVPYDIAGETNLLAAYTCTPLVKIPVSQLKAGERLKGTTVAELGNRNNPLDMVAYQKDGKDYILIANSSRGIMKVTMEGIDKAKPITQAIGGGGTAGQSYETIKDLKGVDHMAKLDKGHALLLQRGEGGSLSLVSIPLP